MASKFKCDVCGRKFETRKVAEKHERACLKNEADMEKMKSQKFLSESEIKKLSWKEKREYVREWHCTCHNCDKKWNYLDNVEKKMKSQVSTNACVQLGSCCNPCVGLAASNANTQLDKQIQELKQCPECKSSNVKREARYFKKK